MGTFVTLSDAQKLTQNMMVRGVIEALCTESAVLDYLPFVDVVGSAFVYNQEATLGTTGFQAINTDWTADAPTFNQKTATLKILGGNADVDNFLAQTYRNVNDIKAEVVAAKAKSVAYSFNDAFFNGNSSTNANSFDGLDTLIPAGQTLPAGTNGAALSLDMLDMLIDMVKPGKPDVLFVSRRTRRKMKALRRASGSILEQDVNAFGRRVDFYDGIPVVVDENIRDDKVVGSSGAACSTIYACQFGLNRGVVGLMNGMLDVVNIGDLETRDASRIRIRWYVGLALMRDIAAAKLTAINGN